MAAIALFSIQFTLSLAAYLLIGFWYVRPRLRELPLPVALSALVWVHVFRIIGGTILAPGSVDPAVPSEFRTMVGLGDVATAALALIAVVGLRLRPRLGVGLTVVCIGVGLIDTVNAVIQSVRYEVFSLPLGLNWVIVTMYVPALLVSSLLVVMELRRQRPSEGYRPA